MESVLLGAGLLNPVESLFVVVTFQLKPSSSLEVCQPAGVWSPLCGPVLKMRLLAFLDMKRQAG